MICKKNELKIFEGDWLICTLTIRREKKSCNYYYNHSELASCITFVAYFNPFQLFEFSIWLFWLKRVRYDCCILNLLLGCLKCKNCSFHLLWRRPNVWSLLVNQWLGRLWILKWVATNSLTLKKRKRKTLSPKTWSVSSHFYHRHIAVLVDHSFYLLYTTCVYTNLFESMRKQRHNNPWVKMEHLMIESITDCLYVNCIISKKTATKDHNKTSHITHINCTL